MKNIVVVCLDYGCALKIGKQLSKVLNMQLFDADICIKNGLINSIDFPLNLSNDLMQIKEKSILSELSEKENAIITITGDEFISNENYKLFSNSFKILIELDLNNKIKENIQKLIKKQCNFSENIKNFKINNLINKLN